MFYLFIVADNEDEYKKYYNWHTARAKHYNVSYTFIIIKQTPNSSLTPINDDTIIYSGNTTSTQKFVNVLQTYFESFMDAEDIPEYIVYIKADKYVHYPTIKNTLSSLPKEKVLAGSLRGFYLENLLIFSKDVVMNILNDPIQHSKSILICPTDVALSTLSKPYCEWIDLADKKLVFTDNKLYEEHYKEYYNSYYSRVLMIMLVLLFVVVMLSFIL